MSVLSVSQIKRGYTTGTKTVTHAPREGSNLRRLYDAFMTGRPVNIRDVIPTGKRGSHLTQLRDFYGMEFKPDGYGKQILIGRYDGPYFVPIERFNEL